VDQRRGRREFERTAPPTPAQRIGDVLAGVERSGPVTYRLYRSSVPDGSPRVPGCVVIVNIEAEGSERARQWVDFMFDDMGAEAGTHPGLISANMHISTDGTRVLNYAEWTDEEAHRAMVASAAPAEVARVTEGVPGVRPVGFRRYALYRSLIRPQPPSGA
jgi:heme-degrading monooxygenase HmoA